MSVYELSAEAIGGPVDIAFSGAIMLHLRDPVRALERIAEALRPGGELRLLEPFSPRLTVLSPRRPAASFGAATEGFQWWLPNLAALGGWLRAAGLRDERRLAIVRPPRAGRDPRVAGGVRRLGAERDAGVSGGPVDRCYHRQGLANRGRAAAKCGFPAPFEGLFSSANTPRFGAD